MSRELMVHLEDHNPFVSNSVGDPRNLGFASAGSLGDDILARLRGLIRQKSRPGAPPMAALVLGEAGTGKTHLIGRLMQGSGSEEAGPCFPTYVLPFVDPTRAFQYLLRRIIINLARPGRETDPPQLEVLGGLILARTLTRIARGAGRPDLLDRIGTLTGNPAQALDRCRVDNAVRAKWMAHVQDQIREDHPDIAPGFTGAFLDYLFYPEHRPAALTRMTGRLDPAEEGRPWTEDPDPDQREQQAQEHLLALDALLAFFHRPLVVCFDQLENLDGEPAVHSFQKLVFFLSDVCRGCLPVAFFRGEEWRHRISTRLDHFSSARFQANLFELKGCSKDQALDLIRSRLDGVLSGFSRPNPLFPFWPDYKEPLDRLLKFKESYPRQVINRAGRLLAEILGARTDEPVRNRLLDLALENRRAEEQMEAQWGGPDKERLIQGLELFLSHLPAQGAFQAQDLIRNPEGDRYLDLVGALRSPQGLEARVALIVDLEENPTVALAGLKRGINILESSPGARAAIIRDSRKPIPPRPKWPATHDQLDRFQSLGGLVLHIEVDDYARWAAIARLGFDLKAGDIVGNRGEILEPERLGPFLAQEAENRMGRAWALLSGYLAEVFPPVGPRALKSGALGSQGQGHAEVLV